jgi:hypothetical protein
MPFLNEARLILLFTVTTHRVKLFTVLFYCGTDTSCSHHTDTSGSDTDTSGSHTSGLHTSGSHTSGLHTSGSHTSGSHTSGSHTSGSHTSGSHTTCSHYTICVYVHVPQHNRFTLYDLHVCIRSVSMYMIRLYVYVTTHQVQAVHRALLYMSHNTTGSHYMICMYVYDPSVCIRSVCMYVYDLHVCIRSACMYMIRLYVYVTTHRVQARLLLYFTITIQHVHTIRSACMPI